MCCNKDFCYFNCILWNNLVVEDLLDLKVGLVIVFLINLVNS